MNKENRINILILANDFGPPWTDGIKNSGRHIAARLSEKNVVRCIGFSNARKSFDYEGCQVDLVKSPFFDTWLRKVFMIFGILNLAYSSKRLCKDFTPDVVVSNLETMSMGIVGWLISRRLSHGKTPHIQIIFADYFTFKLAPLKPWLSEYLPHWLFNNRLISKLGLTLADGNIAISHYLVDRIERLGARNVAYAPVGVDASLFKPNLHLRKQYSESFVIGYLGHTTYVKGASLLVDAFRKVSKDLDIRLIISLTKGSESDFFKNLQEEENVTLLGPTNAAEFFASCDAYVLPRRAIHGTVNLPNTVLEAMACGTVVLTTCLPGVDELIEENKTGYFFDLDDENELVRKIEYIESHPHDRARVAQQARIQVVDGYSWSNLSRRVEEMIHEEI